LLTEAAILSALAGRLAKFKAPKQVFVGGGPAAQRDGQGAEGGAAGDVQGRLSLIAVGVVTGEAAPFRLRRCRVKVGKDSVFRAKSDASRLRRGQANGRSRR
jgi:hypothetical protein